MSAGAAIEGYRQEVLSRGLCNFSGYVNCPDLEGITFNAEGWVPTGDLGSLDEDGYLSIIGRKKEILVTAGGKNVSPNQLEDQIRSDALVSQVVVVGDNRPYVGALITLDEEIVRQWLEQSGVKASAPSAELKGRARRIILGYKDMDPEMTACTPLREHFRRVSPQQYIKK